MDLEPTRPRMSHVFSRRGVLLVLCLGAAGLLLVSSKAGAAVGVEHVSRSVAAPGAEVELTLGCGFCFPPCVGPKGNKHPAGSEHGACMLDTKANPPTAFAISLVPIERAPELRPCGPNAVCPPTTAGVPRRSPSPTSALPWARPMKSIPAVGECRATACTSRSRICQLVAAPMSSTATFASEARGAA